MSRMLIVYYSVSNGNTRRIAEQMQRATGADIAEIRTVQPYTGAYQDIVDQGQREVERGYKPEIRPLAVDLADYDVIAVGTPTWWYTMAPAVKTFLESHDWAGKTVIPFQTHGGWPGHTLKDMKQACAGAAFAHEKAIRFDSTGGAERVTPAREVQAWVDSLRCAPDK
ncbi:MAG: flavodoxin [Agathobaculum sp.]